MTVVKNALFKRAELVTRARCMMAAQLVMLGQICLLLMACGNKGDLYLEQVELTEEQKTLLNELDDVDRAGPQGDLERDPKFDSDPDLKKNKQKTAK